MDNLYEENVECDFEIYYCRSECCGRCDWQTDNDILVRQDLINKKNEKSCWQEICRQLFFSKHPESVWTAQTAEPGNYPQLQHYRLKKKIATATIRFIVTVAIIVQKGATPSSSNAYVYAGLAECLCLKCSSCKEVNCSFVIMKKYVQARHFLFSFSSLNKTFYYTYPAFSA